MISPYKPISLSLPWLVRFLRFLKLMSSTLNVQLLHSSSLCLYLKKRFSKHSSAAAQLKLFVSPSIMLAPIYPLSHYLLYGLGRYFQFQALNVLQNLPMLSQSFQWFTWKLENCSNHAAKSGVSFWKTIFCFQFCIL